MGKVFNQKPQKKLRQHLRNQAPDAEKILWSRLKGRQFLGYKFRRQQGIGKFVVDFYCPKVTLAVELDGATHLKDEQMKHDKEKEDFIREKKIHLIRFTNVDVYKNMDGVLLAILDEIKRIEEQPPLTPP